MRSKGKSRRSTETGALARVGRQLCTCLGSPRTKGAAGQLEAHQTPEPYLGALGYRTR